MNYYCSLPYRNDFPLKAYISIKLQNFLTFTYDIYFIVVHHSEIQYFVWNYSIHKRRYYKVKSNLISSCEILVPNGQKKFILFGHDTIWIFSQEGSFIHLINMGQNHPKFLLSHFIKLSHMLANYTKGQVANLLRSIFKMPLELTYRIWITLYSR